MSAPRPTNPAHPPRRARPRRRAFALPLVILLTLVVSLSVAVFMQRSSIGTLAARRQADGYIAHHAGLGMREMVSRWLTTVRGRLKESIEDDGFVFSLDLPGGDRIDVFMHDAQGSALARGDALTGRRREIVETMNAYLDLTEQTRAAAEASRLRVVAGARPATATGQNDELPLRRMYGPSEVSITTAPREVLEALASAITDPRKAADIADALVLRRDDQASTRDLAIEEVTRTLRERGLNDDELNELTAMLVYVPSLYRVTAELRTSSGRILDKARGLMKIDEGRNDPFNQNGPFLTWESVPEDEWGRR